MPVMPAPTTRTSTSAEARSGTAQNCTDRLVYEPRGGALPDRRSRPDPQGALLRRRLLPAGVRAVVAARVADGVPPRGDPATARLRRVRDPRPVDRRAAHRR